MSFARVLNRFSKPLTATLLTLLLAACVLGPDMREDLIRSEPTYARPPANHGVLAEMAAEIYAKHGEDHSGFRLLDRSDEALLWRLALIDSAVSSLDIQTYLWHGDNVGRLILQRAVDAARRGVHVRLIVDDLLTRGQDQLIYELELRPNIEIRLFNPWQNRNLRSRVGEMLVEMERLNTRMHDKLIIVDGQAAIVGGRNIGDHYFGLNKDYNFHDLDLLGFGHIAIQANAMFDHFWNSELVVSGENLDTETDPEFVEETWNKTRASNAAAPELKAFGAEARDWSAELAQGKSELRVATSKLVYDEAEIRTGGENMAQEMFNFLAQAQSELLITNAYVIPAQRALDRLKELTDRGVKIRLLTNSLASHDVPAVNSHYKEWRDDFVRANVELYELRADPAIKSMVDVAPVVSEFTGLHTKAVVRDRRHVFIGSMNFDPRSLNINTEAGAFIDSPELAADLIKVMERDMQPENAWQVLLDEKGKPYWVNSDETLTRQPARGTGQRVMEVLLGIFPKEQY